MDPISNHQGRGDTKRKQAAVLLKRTLHDMRERAAMSELHDIAFTLNGKLGLGQGRGTPASRRFPAPNARTDRNAYRLRARRVRRVQHHDRRTLRAKLSDAGGPGRRVEDRNHRRTDGAERHRRSAARIRGPQCLQCGYCTPGILATATELLGPGQAVEGRDSRSSVGKLSAAAPDIKPSLTRSKPLPNCRPDRGT